MNLDDDPQWSKNLLRKLGEALLNECEAPGWANVYEANADLVGRGIRYDETHEVRGCSCSGRRCTRCRPTSRTMKQSLTKSAASWIA
jgi:hypothetical protein